VEYIRERGEGFQVTSLKSARMQQVLQFVRALYSLEGVEDFPFEDQVEVVANSTLPPPQVVKRIMLTRTLP
jgi:hypothetical protein